MPKPSLIILLVEDLRHRQFTLKYLKRLGFGTHEIRVRMSPSGVGSAEQWVREHLPIEFEACRQRQAKAKTRLMVVIDADSRSIQDRLRELNAALQESQGSAVTTDQKILVRLIPKRNIETWILCLNGELVDEESDYKSWHTDWTKQISNASEALYTWTRNNAEIPGSCIHSLKFGITELQKLKTQ